MISLRRVARFSRNCFIFLFFCMTSSRRVSYVATAKSCRSLTSSWRGSTTSFSSLSWITTVYKIYEKIGILRAQNLERQFDSHSSNSSVACEQGLNEGGKGAQFPGRRITAGGAEKSQQCHKYFFQYTTFASERAQVRTPGAKLAFCPAGPANLVTPLHANLCIEYDCFDRNGGSPVPARLDEAVHGRRF